MSSRQVLICSLLFLLPVILYPQVSRANSPDSIISGEFRDVIAKIESQTGYSIAYATHDIETRSLEVPDFSGLNAREALWKILDPEQYRLLSTGRHIIIKKNPPREPEPPVTIDPVEEPEKGTPQDPVKEPIVDDTPAPTDNGFAGGTRLIIIRNTGKDKHMEMDELLLGEDQNAVEQEENTLHHYRSVAINGNQTNPADTAGRINRKTVPFRADLLEKDVYSRRYARETKSKKEKKRAKRKRRS